MNDIIDIKPLEGDRYRVTVSGKGEMTTHRVSVSDDELARYGRGDQDKQALLEDAFAFLLEREAKEAILSSFALSEIENHFPEFSQRS